MRFQHNQRKQTSNRGRDKNSDYGFMSQDNFDDAEDELPFNYSAKPLPSVEQYNRKLKHQQSNTTVARSLTTIDKIAIVIILILMGFWTLMILALTIPLQNSNIFLGVFISLIAYWSITWISYYVGWRFYWIMLAIGWMLATGYTLMIFGTVQQFFYQLF